MRRKRQGIRLTMSEQAEVHRRVEAGETFERVSRAIGCSTKSIYRLMHAGGRRSPRQRTCSAYRLSLKEREDIARGLQAGDSFGAISRRIGRAPQAFLATCRLWGSGQLSGVEG